MIQWDDEPQSGIVWDENPKEQPYPLQRRMQGLAEAGLNMFSSLPGALGGGLNFLGTLGATGGDVDAAVAVKQGTEETINDKLQYQPRTESGKQYTENLGKGMEWAINKGEDVGKVVFDAIPGMQGEIDPDFAGTTGRVWTEGFMEIAPIGPVAAARPKGKKGPRTTSEPAPTLADNLKKIDEAPAQQPAAPGDLPRIQGLEEAPPAIPELPPVDRPLPEINTGMGRPEDTVPMLREPQPQIPPRETPLPTIDPRMAATGDMLDFADPQVFDRGTRPVGSDGTPLRGMAEDVPTVDFPLRQEVLEQPAIKEAIDNFRMEAERLRQAGDQAGLDNLVRDFTAGMQRLGIAKASDAYGRGLYEGGADARYLETGIRRGGEQNPNLATMPEVPQLPFGGKQPKAGEVVPISEKKFTFVPKKQKGAYNPSVFAEGFTRMVEIPSRGLRFVWKSMSDSMTGWKEAQVQLVDKKGNVVADAMIRPNNNKNLEADMVKTYGEGKGKRLPELLYMGISKVGDVERSPIQTDAGKRMWDRFGESGLTKDGKTIPWKQDVPFVPKSQRGGAKGTWNPYEAKQAVTNAINSVQKSLEKGFPKSTESQKQAVVNKIPGMKDVRYLTPDAEFTPELKNQILSEPDGSSVWMFTPGRVARQEIGGKTNIFVATAGRYWENARNRYEILMDRDVEPMKKAINRVVRNPKEVESLTTILNMEMERGKRYTPDQLREAGASDKVIDAYVRLRDNFDNVIKRINEVRAAKNKKPITAMEAYQSSRWLGPWQAKVLDAEGKIVYWIAEPSALARKRAMDYITSERPDLRITEVKYDSRLKNQKDSLEAIYPELIKLLGEDDPAVMRISEMMNARNAAETANIAGVEQHFKSKTGKGGYAGDRPWADKASDQKAFLEQQVAYIQSTLLWAEQQKALELTNKMLNDPDIQKNKPNNVEYIKELSKMEMGWDSAKIMRELEEFVSKYTGQNPQRYAEGLGLAKSFFYMTKLGLSLPYMTVSVLQPMLVMPAAVLHGKAKIGSTLGGMIIDGQMLAMRQMINEYGPQRNILPEEMRAFFEKYKPEPLIEEATQYAYTNRVTEVNQLSDIRDIQAGPVRQFAERTVGATISLPELMARSTTYMGFVQGLKHKHDISTFEGRLKLFEEASEKTKEVMGDYNPEQKAPIYQRMGLTGNALSTLQTFMINQAYQMWKYSKEASKGNVLPLAAHLMAMWTFAGATGMFGVDDAEDMINFIKEHVLSDAQYADGDVLGKPELGKWKDLSVKNAILEGGSDLFTYGPVSKATGLNLYSRFSTGDFLQAPPFEGSGANMAQNYLPFITDLIKQVTAVKTLATGNTAQRLEAGYVLTPAGFRGLYEENVPGVKRGSMQPQMSDMTLGQSIRSEKDSAIRETGFRAFEEQTKLDESFRARVQNNVTKARIESLQKKVKQNILYGEKDELNKNLQSAVKLGHNPSAWLESADRTVQNAYLTLAQREVVRLSKLKNPTPEQLRQLKVWTEITNAK